MRARLLNFVKAGAMVDIILDSALEAAHGSLRTPITAPNTPPKSILVSLALSVLAQGPLDAPQRFVLSLIEAVSVDA